MYQVFKSEVVCEETDGKEELSELEFFLLCLDSKPPKTWVF